MRLRRVLLLTTAFAFVACAVMEPPDGGPKDETPPRMTGIIPAPGSAGVDVNSSIRILFSEKIDGDSFKKLVTVYPPLEFEKIKAKGEVLEISFREAMPETTMCVIIRKGYADNHNVKGARELLFYFSTADSLDSGSISGRVLFKMAPDSTGLARLVSVSEIDSTGDVTRAGESRTAFCAADGSFTFEALPTDGKMFRIWAFTDRNGDMRYSPGDEFSTVLGDTFTLTTAMTSVSGLEINIIDPDEPGRIEGTINDLTGLGIPATAWFAPLFEDGNPVFVRADSTGLYTVKAIPPGDYAFTAFVDVLSDSIPGAYPDPADSTAMLPEPLAVYPDTVAVPPGGKITLDPVLLKKDAKRDE